MRSRRHDNRSFWRRLRRDYGRRFCHDAGPSRDNKNQDGPATTTNPHESGRGRIHHLTLDQLAARRKFEQLKLLTTTDLAIVNSAEPYRVSNFDLFKRSLLDPSLYVTISLVLIICRLINGATPSLLSSIMTFTLLFLALDYHVESYRSFASVEQSVELLSKNYKLRKAFLSTHLGFNPTRQIRVPVEQSSGGQPQTKELQVEVAEAIDEMRADSFHWINRIIVFFWPYLSHLIHYELNEFFRDQIESGSLGRSDEGMKRLLYALVRQLNTNILVIERCQLGDQAPFIRNISAFEGTEDPKIGLAAQDRKEKPKDGPSLDKNRATTNNTDIGNNSTKNAGKTLVYNINLEYSGDMNIAVIYRYLCCCTSRVGLKDVFLHFNMRLIWGPIKAEIPFIDQLSFTLLELPEFGYKGIALVELAELKIVRGVINRLITENLLYPRVVSISLKQLIEALLNGPDPRARKNPKEAEKREPASPAGVSVSHDSSENNDATSCRTRMVANLLLFGCMCSNAFLRCCQKATTKTTGGRNTEGSSGKNEDYESDANSVNSDPRN